MIGDSVAGGEWGSVRVMPFQVGQGATDAEKEGTARNPEADYATIHAGLAHYLRESGHEVGHLYHPGCSNHRSIFSLKLQTPYEKFIKSHLAYGQYSAFNFKERLGDGKLLHLLPEHEIPWPEIPTYDSLWRASNNWWPKAFDAIVFFWTGPLRSMGELADLGIFLSMEDFQKEGCIGIDQLKFLYRALENSALKELAQLAADLHVPIYLVGGQEDLSVEAVKKFSESYGGFLYVGCESITSMCYPELDKHKPEHFLDPLFKSWSELVVKSISKNVFTRYPTKYVGSRYDLDTLTELKKSIDYWHTFRDTMGHKDAHPDRACHLKLCQKLCQDYFLGVPPTSP